MQLKQREDDIRKIAERMEHQLKFKDKEKELTQEKIVQAKKEIKQLKRGSQMTESERIVELEAKIVGTETRIREMVREIKLLNKLQKDQGRELLGLDSGQQYQEKIKALMQEIKYARDANIDMLVRIEADEKQAKRQKEHLLNLEDNKNELE